MQYTLAEAARLTGNHKTTLFKSIKSGVMSASRDAHGKWMIEPSELQRVYPSTQKNTEEKTVSISSETAVLRAENLLLREQVAALKEEKANLWRKLEDEAKERYNLTVLLAQRNEHTSFLQRIGWRRNV
jgi:hypothetical protein